MEIGGEINVSAERRQGHVTLAVWSRIVDAPFRFRCAVTPANPAAGPRRLLAKVNGAVAASVDNGQRALAPRPKGCSLI